MPWSHLARKEDWRSSPCFAQDKRPAPRPSRTQLCAAKSSSWHTRFSKYKAFFLCTGSGSHTAHLEQDTTGAGEVLKAQRRAHFSGLNTLLHCASAGAEAFPTHERVFSLGGQSEAPSTLMRSHYHLSLSLHDLCPLLKLFYPMQAIQAERAGAAALTCDRK